MPFPQGPLFLKLPDLTMGHQMTKKIMIAVGGENLIDLVSSKQAERCATTLSRHAGSGPFQRRHGGRQ